MSMKKFCFIGALTVASLFPLSAIMPKNNIDLNIIEEKEMLENIEKYLNDK